MKEFNKGFIIQLFINSGMFLIFFIVDYLIKKFIPLPNPPQTDFGTNSVWIIISFFSIIFYNIISVVIVIDKYKKTKKYYAIGFSIVSLLGCGLAIKII